MIVHNTRLKAKQNERSTYENSDFSKEPRLLLQVSAPPLIFTHRQRETERDRQTEKENIYTEREREYAL